MLSMPAYVSLRSQMGLDHEWGLYAYRTAFEDQEIWERYTNYVHNAIIAKIQNHCGRKDPTLPAKVQSSFHLVVKEDKSLEGLTYHEVRDIFVWWIAAGGAEDEGWIDHGMYDWYFLYVDRDILEKFRRIDDARKEKTPDYITEEVPVMMVRAHSLVCETDPDDTWCSKFEGDPAEEDADKEWQYVSAYYIPEFIDFHRGDGEAWFTFFKRPPGVWNTP
ncbi:hypothetical protein F4679DRAFT_600323 [Xylaria curta]|nr:hypothetical protein F4679DRAFT_600323 [Xylaria curta]